MGKKGAVCEDLEEPDSPLNVAAVRDSIRNETTFVKQLMDAVPPQIYFAAETVEELKEEKHQKADQKLSEIGLKRNGGGSVLSKRAKHKRAKLDPAQQWTVSSIHRHMALNRDTEVTINFANHDSKLAADKAISREDLKKKLHDKLQAIRNNYKPSVGEDLEKKREKRRLSKMKMREKRKKQVKVGVTKAEKASKVAKPEPKKLLDAKSIVFNKDKSLLFNKFEFAEEGKEEKIKGEYSGKNYKRLIQKVEHEEEKMKKLEEGDNREKVEHLKEKKKWKTVMSRAEGVKVKDDLSLLKRALNKQQQRKKQSGKKWMEREENVKKKQEARQKKRTANIKARKQEKIKKKIKRSIKKGRMIPGIQNI